MANLELQKGKYSDYSSFHEMHDKLKEEGFSIFTWQDQPGAAYENHSHPQDELIVVASGKLVLLVAENRYELSEGDALVLPANTVHSAINEERIPVSYFICTQS